MATAWRGRLGQANKRMEHGGIYYPPRRRCIMEIHLPRASKEQGVKHYAPTKKTQGVIEYNNKNIKII
jgi:hypothetical protein